MLAGVRETEEKTLNFPVVPWIHKPKVGQAQQQDNLEAMQLIVPSGLVAKAAMKVATG